MKRSSLFPLLISVCALALLCSACGDSAVHNTATPQDDDYEILRNYANQENAEDEPLENTFVTGSRTNGADQLLDSSKINYDPPEGVIAYSGETMAEIALRDQLFPWVAVRLGEPFGFADHMQIEGFFMKYNFYYDPVDDSCSWVHINRLPSWLSSFEIREWPGKDFESIVCRNKLGQTSIRFDIFKDPARNQSAGIVIFPRYYVSTYAVDNNNQWVELDTLSNLDNLPEMVNTYSVVIDVVAADTVYYGNYNDVPRRELQALMGRDPDQPRIPSEWEMARIQTWIDRAFGGDMEAFLDTFYNTILYW